MKLIVASSALLLCLFFSCESSTKIDIDQVIEEKVQERLETYRRIVEGNCAEKAMTEAGRLADSIILERARLQRDTSQRPYRPFRPEEPELKTLKDSLPLRPLFDSLGKRIDTLPEKPEIRNN